MKKSACVACASSDALAQRHEVIAAAHRAPRACRAVESISSATRRAIARTTSFSSTSARPLAPGSSPPCPASIATTTSRPRPGAGAARRTTGIDSVSREVYDEAMAVLFRRREQECLGLRGGVELEHDAQIATGTRPPARTDATTPRPSGNASELAVDVSGRSITTRSGSVSAKTRCSTGPVSSNTARVPSGPDQRRMPLTVAAAATRPSRSSASNAPSRSQPLTDTPTPLRSRDRLMFTRFDRLFQCFLRISDRC